VHHQVIMPDLDCVAFATQSLEIGATTYQSV
jgi:hypothetical protein